MNCIRQVFSGPAIAFAVFIVLVQAGVHAATFTVTTEADSGAGSLREAILQATSSNAPDTIVFAAGVTRIRPQSQLPELNTPMGGETILGHGVTLDGQDLAGIGTGLLITTNGHRIEGLTVINFPAQGIHISGGDGNVVVGCRVGTDGIQAFPNGIHGIVVEGDAHDNVIGGTTPAERNLVSGNNERGIQIGGSSSSGNRIIGNYVGTNAAGTLAVANGVNGVAVLSSAGPNFIGGSGAGEGNLISGNGSSGIRIGNSPVSGVVIQGNRIGTNAAGTASVANLGSGIDISFGAHTIGGAGAGAGNIVSGNAVHGIRLIGSTGITIRGNRIGTNAAGTAAVGNTSLGITLDNCGGVSIGGTLTGMGNVISGNAGGGIQVSSSPGTVIQGNFIGTNSSGTGAAGTQPIGVHIVSTSGVQIGGLISEAGNRIGFHTMFGVHVASGSGNLIRRNRIFGSANEGIRLNAGANEDIAQPIITDVEPLAGMALANAVVELFVDDADEGRIFLGQIQSSNFGTFEAPFNLFPHVGRNVTATVTKPGTGSTSPFSAPVAISGVSNTVHSADPDSSMSIELSELLRGIQLFNSNGFHCDDFGEDRFAPGPGDRTCVPHASDYNPQDWAIRLSELLRLIQFYNLGAYTPCGGGEDGFCGM